MIGRVLYGGGIEPVAQDNILEFIEEMMALGYDEEFACRMWARDHDPNYDPEDWENTPVSGA